MSESEYITKEMEQHPEPVYLADLRILTRFVQNGSFGYREPKDVVFQTLTERYPEAYGAFGEERRRDKYILRRMRLCRKSGMIYPDIFFWLPSWREEGGGEVAVFYCRCKNRFWAEFWWKPDKDEHKWVFFDDHKESETYGESVTRCSGCGERLHRGMLTPA